MTLISFVFLETTKTSIFDPSDPRLWLFFSLVILIALMVWKKVPALLTKSLDERADLIRKELDDARRLREEAQELLASYERRQREAQIEAEEIIAQAKKEAGLFAIEAREKLQDVLARRAEAATRKIEQAEKSAAAEVRNRAAILASSIAEHALAESLNKASQGKLVDDGIEELGKSLQ